MLSDKEKKAIEWLKKADWFSARLYAPTILNLIEKQSKEIEHQKEKRENQKKELAILNAKQIEFNKLVNTVNSYKGQFKRQEKEIEDNKKYIDLHYVTYEQYTSKLNELNKKWKDKIEAKIEELEKMNIHEFETMNVLEVLQSLLEKEGE